MAAVVARVGHLRRIISLGVFSVRSVGNNHVYLFDAVSSRNVIIDLSKGVRQISRFPQSKNKAASYFETNEDEEEYEVNLDEDLEGLRKRHREQARNQHVGHDGVQFSDFSLNEKLLRRLEQLGYREPFDIQSKTLEHTLAGKDVIGRAVTGSGKTLAFSIPIVHKILESGRQKPGSRSPKAIVISPTRELALQIYRSIQELDASVRCVALYGGDSFIKQERAIRQGVDVVCATPGRLNDHLQRRSINLQALEFLCLDEADELLTPNFKEQILDVLEHSGDKQVMLFSATMPPDIKRIAYRYMKNAEYVDIAKSQKLAAPTSVRHLCMKIPANQHLSVVQSLLLEHQPERCIVFMPTKDKTRQAASIMRKSMGLKADGIHSDLSQNRREVIMAAFRKGLIKVLVATDVAARGLDIPEIDLIIQVGPPQNGTEYYIHRSGRTGRAGREGLAIMLHSGQGRDWEIITQVERLVKLEHTQPPNMTKLMQSAAFRIAKRLQHVNPKDIEATLPAAQSLDLEGIQGQELMAAALAMIVQQGTGTESGSSSREQRGRHRHRPAHFHSIHSSQSWDEDGGEEDVTVAWERSRQKRRNRSIGNKNFPSRQGLLEFET